VIEWHFERAAEAVQTFAAASLGVLGDQGVIIIRTALVAFVAWGTFALLETRNELAIVRTKQVDVLRRLDDNDRRIEAGTDDRWRRRDHDAYAAAVDVRIEGLSSRVDGQSRIISTLVAKAAR
jgi:hypothetical protein